MRTIIATALVIAGCHDVTDGVFPYTCPASHPVEGLSDRLSETGLYADVANDELTPGVLQYKPRFELWSDGAEKRRWLFLPPGTQIDTSDPDDWLFPDGTRVWKEFTQDGVRVETRLIAKVGEDWLAQAYMWLPDESDAIAVPAGYIDARGTTHDVPASGECQGCHAGRRSFLLGISAVQLGYDAPPGDADLHDLAAANALSTPLGDTIALPGDEAAQAALGYLHANCGHCHNSAQPERPCLSPDVHDFWLRTGDLASVESTSTYASARDAGDKLLRRMSRRSIPGRMPPLGSRVVDDTGVAVVRAWMESLR